MTAVRGRTATLMLVFGALLGLGLLAASGIQSEAVAAEKCPSGQTYMREFGCVKKAEIRTAKATCKAAKRPMIDCLCDPGKACKPPSEQAKSCKKNQTFVAKWGCVKDSEIKQAAKTCAALDGSPLFTECLCQDGDLIGACGD